MSILKRCRNKTLRKWENSVFLVFLFNFPLLQKNLFIFYVFFNERKKSPQTSTTGREETMKFWLLSDMFGCKGWLLGSEQWTHVKTADSHATGHFPRCPPFHRPSSADGKHLFAMLNFRNFLLISSRLILSHSLLSSSFSLDFWMFCWLIRKMLVLLWSKFLLSFYMIWSFENLK